MCENTIQGVTLKGNTEQSREIAKRRLKKLMQNWNTVTNVMDLVSGTVD